MIIKDWSEQERPREKLFFNGRLALTDTELLAILIGSGNQKETALCIARKILSNTDYSLNDLSKLSVHKLMKFRGIGKVKALTIIAALELGRRQRNQNVITAFKLNSSQSVFDLMQPILGDLDHEEFWILLLNNANKLKYKWQLSIGGITATLVDVRLIYKKALEIGATSIILCHNHPSGNLKPSQSDMMLTKKIMKGAKLLDVKILDHVIVTEKSFFSFADEGRL